MHECQLRGSARALVARGGGRNNSTKGAAKGKHKGSTFAYPTETRRGAFAAALDEIHSDLMRGLAHHSLRPAKRRFELKMLTNSNSSLKFMKC